MKRSKEFPTIMFALKCSHGGLNSTASLFLDYLMALLNENLKKLNCFVW